MIKLPPFSLATHTHPEKPRTRQLRGEFYQYLKNDTSVSCASKHGGVGGHILTPPPPASSPGPHSQLHPCPWLSTAAPLGGNGTGQDGPVTQVNSTSEVREGHKSGSRGLEDSSLTAQGRSEWRLSWKASQKWQWGMLQHWGGRGAAGRRDAQRRGGRITRGGHYKGLREKRQERTGGERSGCRQVSG